MAPRRGTALLLGMLACLALLLAGAGAAAAPPPAARADDPGVAVAGENGFLQVRDNGQLWYYFWNGTGFVGNLIDGGGWGQTKVVALLSPTRFVEVKGDALRSWAINEGCSGYCVRFLETVDTGWSNTRLITGVGDLVGDGGADFVQVRTTGDLMLYRSQGTGYVLERWLDNGYEHARLIAGTGHASALAFGHFVEVNDLGDLWSVTVTASGGRPGRSRLMSGWQNVRLLSTGGTVPGVFGDDRSFVSVRYDGQLVQWYSTVGIVRWQPGYDDTNWFNARLIG